MLQIDLEPCQIEKRPLTQTEAHLLVGSLLDLIREETEINEDRSDPLVRAGVRNVLALLEELVAPFT